VFVDLQLLLPELTKRFAGTSYIICSAAVAQRLVLLPGYHATGCMLTEVM
jgi:hypothetical protein